MKDIVTEAQQELDGKKREQIKKFVSNKLTRKDEIKKEIERLSKELEEIDQSIERIGNEDYTEVDQSSGTLNLSMGSNLTWGRSYNTSYPYDISITYGGRLT